jgi:hypothetical protein
VAKSGITCGMIFHVVVDGGKVVITVARQDRAGGKAVKEETRTVPLIDFIDAIHRKRARGAVGFSRQGNAPPLHLLLAAL